MAVKQRKASGSEVSITGYLRLEFIMLLPRFINPPAPFAVFPILIINSDDACKLKLLLFIFTYPIIIPYKVKVKRRFLFKSSTFQV